MLIWVVSDSGLTFGSPDTIKIYVNGRPVNDKIIKKALLDAYTRQITPGEYPFAVLLLQIKPSLVDVNVHPKKLEVKFIDSHKIFNIVHESVKKTLGIHKITTVDGWFGQFQGGQKSDFVSGSAPVQQGFGFGGMGSFWCEIISLHLFQILLENFLREGNSL